MKEACNICFADALYEENCLMFIENQTKALLKYDFENNTLNLLSSFYDTEYVKRAIRKIIKAGNEIYYVQQQGYQLICSKMNEENVENEFYKSKFSNQGILKMAYLSGDKIWLIPLNTENNVVLFDINKKSFDSIGSVSENLRKNKLNFQGNTIEGIKNYEQTIFFTVNEGNILYEFNISNLALEEYRLPIEEKINSFDYDGNYFWFAAEKGFCLYKWKVGQEKAEKYLLQNPSDEEVNDKKVRVFITTRKDVLAVAALSNTICFAYEKEKCLVRLKGLDKIERIERRRQGILSIENKEIDGKVYLCPFATPYMIAIDLENMSVANKKMYLSETTRKKMYFPLWEKKKIAEESEEGDILEFIKWIDIEGDSYNANPDGGMVSIGKKVLDNTLI